MKSKIKLYIPVVMILLGLGAQSVFAMPNDGGGVLSGQECNLELVGEGIIKYNDKIIPYDVNKFEAKAECYSTPAESGEGKPKSLVGFSLTLKNGNKRDLISVDPLRASGCSVFSSTPSFRCSDGNHIISTGSKKNSVIKMYKKIVKILNG